MKRSKFREFLIFLSLLFIPSIQIVYLFNPYSLVQQVYILHLPTFIQSCLTLVLGSMHALSTEKCPMHMQFGIVPDTDAFRHKRAKH